MKKRLLIVFSEAWPVLGVILFIPTYIAFFAIIEWAISVEHLVNHGDDTEDTILESIIESKHEVENLRNENRRLEQEISRLKGKE